VNGSLGSQAPAKFGIFSRITSWHSFEYSQFRWEMTTFSGVDFAVGRVAADNPVSHYGRN